MNETNTTPEPEDDLTLPKALVDALRRVDAGHPGAAGLQARPAASDAAFLARAAAELAAARAADLARLNARRRMRLALWSGGALLAAASVALVVSLSLQEAPAPAPRSGDIRDAFALARALRDGEKPSAGDDANHDGTVDGADVRVLAMAAVSLKGAP